MNISEQRPRDRRSGPYRFGEFVLDAESGFLHRGSEEVPLQPKAFEVLTFLVERHARLVTKEELIDAVWGERRSRTIPPRSAWCRSAGLWLTIRSR